MANYILKDIPEPETATGAETSVFVALPNSALPDVAPALPLPEDVLLSPAQEQRRKQIAAYGLRGTVHQPGPNDWKKTVGMFKDDPIMKEIAEEGRRIRESEKPD